jgi:serine/threonine protein phosphatase PrpC
MIIAHKITYLNELGGRENLEDAIYPLPGAASKNDKLFLVCDGVGGENKGEVASYIASKEFPRFFDESPPGEDFDADAYLGLAQNHVLGEMKKYAVSHPDAIKMSTTITLAYITNKGVLTAWCGDSRIYHIRDGNILWQSIDHSLVAKLVEQGEITEHEAKNHAQRNIIIRSLSASGKTADIDAKWLIDIQDNDYLMLCTDGVLENINDVRLREILNNPQEDKKALFLDYSSGKTKDNFSLYLLKLFHQKTEGPSAPQEQITDKKKRSFPVLLFIIVLLIAAASTYLWLNIKYFNINDINIFKTHKDTSLKRKSSAQKINKAADAQDTLLKKDSLEIIPPIPKKPAQKKRQGNY